MVWYYLSPGIEPSRRHRGAIEAPSRRHRGAIEPAIEPCHRACHRAIEADHMCDRHRAIEPPPSSHRACHRGAIELAIEASRQAAIEHGQMTIGPLASSHRGLTIQLELPYGLPRAPTSTPYSNSSQYSGTHSDISDTVRYCSILSDTFCNVLKLPLELLVH